MANHHGKVLEARESGRLLEQHDFTASTCADGGGLVWEAYKELCEEINEAWPHVKHPPRVPSMPDGPVTTWTPSKFLAVRAGLGRSPVAEVIFC